jgi:hypothetical protein
MSYYLENSEEKLAIQISNFATKIDTYAASFGLTATETLSIRNDASYFAWVVNNMKKIDSYKKNWTAFKTILLKGEDEVSSNPTPVPPTLDIQPVAVAPGVLKRFTTMVNRVKAHPAYTTAIGQNLGIEVTASPAIATTDAKPALKTTLSGDKVLVQWTKGKFSGILLEKDSGSGYVLLDKDFMPDYLDNTAMPAAGQTAIWKYRAIYLLRDEKAGQWSDEVSITVTGK